METVASHVRARYPTTTPLMWDDMLRDIPEDQLSGWWTKALAGGRGVVVVQVTLSSGASWCHEGWKPSAPSPQLLRRDLDPVIELH